MLKLTWRAPRVASLIALTHPGSYELAALVRVRPVWGWGTHALQFFLSIVSVLDRENGIATKERKICQENFPSVNLVSKLFPVGGEENYRDGSHVNNRKKYNPKERNDGGVRLLITLVNRQKKTVIHEVVSSCWPLENKGGQRGEDDWWKSFVQHGNDEFLLVEFMGDVQINALGLKGGGRGLRG